MKIEGDGRGSVVIWLTLEEADQIQIDHGELEIAIPCDDTLGAVLEIGQALRDADPAR